MSEVKASAQRAESQDTWTSRHGTNVATVETAYEEHKCGVINHTSGAWSLRCVSNTQRFWIDYLWKE